jgi:hypothetical protein
MLRMGTSFVQFVVSWSLDATNTCYTRSGSAAKREAGCVVVAARGNGMMSMNIYPDRSGQTLPGVTRHANEEVCIAHAQEQNESQVHPNKGVFGRLLA